MKQFTKPVKREKVQITSKEFREKYGAKKLDRLDKSMNVKGSEYSKLVKDANTWFSRFIRLRDSDKEGIGKCICCNELKKAKHADCGHYHSRRYKSLRWDEDNAHLQSKQHNLRMGDPLVHQGYQRNLIKKIGQESYDKIEVRKHNIFKPTIFELQVLINDFKDKVEILLKEKEIKKWW
jgi:hypothetical protein